MMNIIIKKNGKFPPNCDIASEVIFVKGYVDKGEYPICCINNGVVLLKFYPFLNLAINSVMKGYNSTAPELNHFP